MDNKPPFPNDPPPQYSEFAPPQIDTRNAHFQPNFIPNLPNNPHPSTINSSVIPILPNAPPIDHHFVPNYGSTVILVNEPVNRPLLPTENFVCPVCNIGLLEREFTLLGLLLAIFLFPFGLLCLFFLRKWRCSLCGASLGY